MGYESKLVNGWAIISPRKLNNSNFWAVKIFRYCFDNYRTSHKYSYNVVYELKLLPKVWADGSTFWCMPGVTVPAHSCYVCVRSIGHRGTRALS